MKILVLGYNGMAGSMISKHLSEFYQVDSWGRSQFNYPCEMTALSQYDYVINCIGLIKQKSNDVNLLNSINNELPHDLVPHCQKLIHLSSDCVFSGKLPFDKSYRVNAATDAEDDYGKSKAEGEKINAMVLRTSIIGPAKDNYGLFEWFRNFQDAQVKGFTNHIWSGVTTLELSIIIKNIIEYQLYKVGIEQIASENISKYDLLHLINKAYSLDKKIIPFQSTENINRSLYPTIKADKLSSQINDLKRYENR